MAPRRKSRFEEEAIEIWASLATCAPAEAKRWEEDLSFHARHFELMSLSFADYRVKDKPLAVRRKAEAVRATLARWASEHRSAAMEIEALRATPAHREPPDVEGEPVKRALPGSSPTRPLQLSPTPVEPVKRLRGRDSSLALPFDRPALPPKRSF